MPAAPERQPAESRTRMHALRDVLALGSITAAILLAAAALLASQAGTGGLRWTATWMTAGATAAAWLVAGIGLWAGRRWAPHGVAVLAFGTGIASLVVASGLTARSVRLAMGGPQVPVLIAIGSGVIGTVAVWLARRPELERSGPVTGVGAVIAGVAGAVVSAILVSSAMDGAALGGWPWPATVAVLGGQAALFGTMLAYGVHRLTTGRRFWPMAIPAVVLVVPLVAAMASPALGPSVMDSWGGPIHPLREVIPGAGGGGAALTVTVEDTGVTFGIEGFISFVKATTDGKVIWDQRVPEGGLSRMLPAGSYVLEGYIRNCDGWCQLLDPPEPACSVTGSLDRSSSYRLVIDLRSRTCTLTAS